MKFKQSLFAVAVSGITLFTATQAVAAEYAIDPLHSFIEFKTQHLGMSWLHGRFNDLEGTFSYDADKPEANSISLTIDPASVDSNHAERDKHLRSEDFFNVDAFPEVTFKSTSYSGNADSGTLTGELSLLGVSKTIDIPVTKMGEGDDPWGGYRAGFSGTYQLTREDFEMNYNLGPGAAVVELELGIEGVRK